MALQRIPSAVNGARVLQASFLLFVTLAITQESDDLFRMFFYLGMAPATLLLIFRDRVLTGMGRNALCVSSCVLMTWLYLSVYWSQVADLSHVAIRHTRWWLATLVFFLGMVIYARSGFHRSRVHGVVLQCAVIAAALISISLYFYQHRYPDRITGLGLLDEVISAASLLIMLWLISLPGLDFGRRFDVGVALLGLLLVTTYVFLSQSRAPLGVVACIWAGMFLMLVRDAKTRALVFLALIAMVSLLLMLGDVSLLIDGMLQRGGSYRVGLWQIALSHVKEYLWVGVGVATAGADTPMGHDFKALTGGMIGHPHNLFLSMWMFAGLPAMVLTVLVFVFGFWQSNRLEGRERAIFLITIAALFGLSLTAPARLIASPQVLHLMFWTPIALLCGAGMAQREGSRS